MFQTYCGMGKLRTCCAPSNIKGQHFLLPIFSKFKFKINSMPCLRSDLQQLGLTTPKPGTGYSRSQSPIGIVQTTSQVELSGCVDSRRGDQSRAMFTGSYSPPLTRRSDLLELRLSSPALPTASPLAARQLRLMSLRTIRPYQVQDLNSVRRNLTGNNLISNLGYTYLLGVFRQIGQP